MATRELTIVYDSTTLGGAIGTGEAILTGQIDLSEGPDRVTVGATFLVRGDSLAEFGSAVSAFETLMRTPRKKLQIKLDATTIHSWDPSDVSGYNTAPEFRVTGGPELNGSRSALYVCSWGIDLPADTYDQAGRRDSSLTVETGPSGRRIMRVTGEYRATPSVGPTPASATAVYTASEATYIASLQTALTGSWELQDESYTRNDTDTILTFTQVWIERRDLRVVYNGTTINEPSSSSTPRLWDVVQVDEGPDRVVVRAQVVVSAATAGDLATEVASFQTLMRTPRARLQIKAGASTTLWDWDPASDELTGYNTVPNAATVGEPKRAGALWQLFECSWTIDLPADTYAQGGRRDSTVVVSADSSCQRTLRVTGEYRATLGVGATPSSATAVYEASIDTYTASLKTSLGGVWEQLETSYQANDTDTIVTFSEVFRELVFNQAIGTRDHPAIKNEVLVTRLEQSFPGDSPGVAVGRVEYVTVSYQCDVCHTATAGLLLRTLYAGTIRPHIIATVVAEFAPRAYTVLEESEGPNWSRNKIDASMRLMIITGSSTLEYERVVNISEDEGWVLRKPWDGQPFTRLGYQAKGTRIRETTERRQVLGRAAAGVGKQRGGGAQLGVVASGGGGDGGELYSRPLYTTAGGIPQGVGVAKGGGGGAPARRVGVGIQGGGPQWLLMRRPTQRAVERVKGNPAEGVISVTDIETVTVEEWVDLLRPSIALTTGPA